MIPSKIFQSNLAAITRINDRLGPLLAAVNLVETFEPFDARDGSRQLRRREEGRVLGGVSIPEVAARSLVSQFRPGPASVALLEVGSGAEVRPLLEKLGLHQALFLWDDDPTALAGAMHLHDWSDAITSGRLVILCGASMGDVVESHLTDHDGYLPPEQILARPWWNAATQQRYQQQLSAVISRVQQQRGQKLASLLDRWHQALRRPAPAQQWVMLAGPSEQPDQKAMLDLAAAANSPEFGAGLSTLPLLQVDCATMLNRAHLLSNAGARHILVANLTRSQLDLPMPEGLQVITWIRRKPLKLEVGPNDVVLLACKEWARSFQLSPAQWRYLPLAVTEATPLADRDDDAPVYLPQAIANCDPKIYGIQLVSQKAICQAVTELMERSPLDLVPHRAKTLLQHAQRQTGIHLKEDSVKNLILRWIVEVVEPAVALRAVVNSLQRAGIDFDADPMRPHRAAIFVSTDGRVTQPLMDCAASGLPILVNVHSEMSNEDHLADYFDVHNQLGTFDSTSQLVSRLETPPPSARAHLLANHGYVKRLAVVFAGGGQT